MKKKIFCPVKICKSSRVDFSYNFKNLKYYQCKKCEVYFLNPFPNNNGYINKYNLEYFEKNQMLNKDTKKMVTLRENQYLNDLKVLKKFFNDSKKKVVLDYGCGTGNFLSKLKSKIYGYEVNPNVKMNKNIKRISFNEIKNNKYDLVSLRGSIEHIPNFIDIIVLLKKILKNNGLVFITATPNTYNLNFKLNKKSFNQNHWGHIYHFNHVNLSQFFLKFGFYNIHVGLDYYDTVYKNLRKDYKKQVDLFKGKKNITCNPAVGNMMTLVFKKITKY